jgi:hypothetical protein
MAATHNHDHQMDRPGLMTRVSAAPTSSNWMSARGGNQDLPLQAQMLPPGNPGRDRHQKQ